MMGEADKYRQQGDPQQQNQQQYQHQGQSQNQGDYQNQAQYNQGHNNNSNSGYIPPYNGNQQQQQQQPVNDYDHPYGPPPPYSFNPPQVEDEKYSFNDAFKLEKPRYNDWWAGLLVSASLENSCLADSYI
jgi:transcription initiation factor TFIID subunit TAF12